MKRLFALAIATAAMPAFAQTTVLQSPAYRECSALANSNPAKALVKAEEWIKIDNGLASQHCRAMALFGLRQFAEAGESLTALHDSVAADNIALRVYLTRQATQAWINASRTDEALTLINAQMTELATIKGDNANVAKLTSELLLTRARISITYGKLNEATADLDHAISLTPINTDVLLERASTFEKLNDTGLARSDAEVVLKLDPRNVKAKELLARLNGTPVRK